MAKGASPAAPSATASDDLGRAFTELRASLRNYLRRRVADPGLAEDLVQDVFVKAVSAVEADHAPRNLTAWLYAAARTTLVDHFRSNRVDLVGLDEDPPDTQRTDDERLHQALATCLRPLVGQLPAIYRDTLLATDFDGRTMRAVAAEQGLSTSAIKSRVSRARVMLKETLLTCCHVQSSAGLVTDYHLRTSDAMRRCCGQQCEPASVGTQPER